MSVRRLQTMDALAVLSSELACADENVDIDFGAVGLYLVGFQVAFCVLTCASVSVLACWLLPPPAVSAVRTLALMALVGTLLVMKPLRVGRPRGVASVFNVLRPSVAVYISALVLEQLVHTCVLPEDALEGGTLRRSIFHGATLLLVLAGLVRARSPRAESDLTFLLATFALLVLAVAPPPAVSHTGPLCQPATLLGAGERLLRAALFAAVYAVLAYAATPRRCVSNDVFVCSARAAAGSVWVLAVHTWLLLVAPVQVIIALFARLAEEDDGLVPSGSKAEWAPLNGTGSITPDRPGCGAGLDLEGAGAARRAGAGAGGWRGARASDAQERPALRALRPSASQCFGGHRSGGRRCNSGRLWRLRRGFAASAGRGRRARVNGDEFVNSQRRKLVKFKKSTAP